MVSTTDLKNAFSVRSVQKVFLVRKSVSKNEVEELPIWEHFLLNSKHKFLNICVKVFSNKKLDYNKVVQQFFNAPCRRLIFSI